ncbi:MAG TPA: tyrosine-type recombinase/integrase [Xanthobacteraceae bacterium]|jgi:integrase
MQRKQLTDQLVTSFAAKRKRYVVYDSIVRALGVRVSPKGRKTFIVVGRFNGSTHPSRRKLGVVGKLTIEQARERALRFDARPSDKFATVAEAYFKHIAKQRRAYEVERCIRRDLLPDWENKAIGSITKRDVVEAVDAVKTRGKISAAHHVLGYARSVFEFAIANDMIVHNPCDRIKPSKLIGRKAIRKRVLSDEELSPLWHAAERAGDYGRLVQLLIVTGQRRGDVANAPRDEFDTSAKLWTIPAERFKSDVPHIVPLSQLALDILAKLPQEGGLFHITGFSREKSRLDKFVHTELRKVNIKAKLTPWTLHDLRRTVRTRLSAITTYEVAELVIGHGKKGLARIYDQHEYLDEMREALDNWATRLQRIVSPDTKGVSAP